NLGGAKGRKDSPPEEEDRSEGTCGENGSSEVIDLSELTLPSLSSLHPIQYYVAHAEEKRSNLEHSHIALVANMNE
ncbi:hypothetical protein L914_08522, partial [Phytophthora nicotianae]